GEDAAHKRVSRALEKLRGIFAKRGIDSTTSTIAETISANSVQAAPAMLAKTASAVALTKGATASISTLTLIKGALNIMAWTKIQTAVVVTAAAFVLTTSVFIVVVQKESLIQGKTESEWIKGIVYYGDVKQRELWHSLGPRGINMLLRAMKPPSANLPEEQAHANRDIQKRAASLLCQLADDREDTSAVPAVINLLQTEKDGSVRAVELAYFEMPIQGMSEKEKAALFPELLQSLSSNDFGERDNALVVLQYYTDQINTVVPLMVNALQDPVPGVRMTAVMALNKIDPQNPASSNFASVLAGCMTGTPGHTPGVVRAVIMLGELHRDPEVAVPALIQALQSSSGYVRANAADSLGRFGGQAETAIPALTKALGDSDAGVRRQAAAALKRINSDAPAN
ncbi:MAG TPA: HEAT repeat domain-containing protein, partial [Candidatus Saccharimonadales bacterium]|nr:HEAT repeat domain-containing protein [Candidatus Saccharimonadales bacterium]